MSYKIHLSLCHMGGDESTFVAQALKDNWVVPLGPNVDAFEKGICHYINNGSVEIHNRVVALNSGTAALHLALKLLGVGEGDEVLCQSFTYVASANPISYLGAKVVFVDSEKLTWNMDPELLESAIKDRVAVTGKLPKAIVVVHLYGMPAQMDVINSLAKKYGIPVLEDAAEALGAELDGRRCGTWGDLAAISFNGNKIITTSGGGALICRTEEEAQRAIFYATQAREQESYYLHSEVGYNYRMSNICAGIGRGQLLVLDKHLERRRAIHKLYRTLFEGYDEITVMENPSLRYDSNFWLTCILIDSQYADCECLQMALARKGIEARRLWRPMHMQPLFSDAPFYGNGTSEELFYKGLCLPSSSILTDDEIETVVEVIKHSL